MPSLFFILISLFSFSLFADDAELYDPAPPTNAAFVRLAIGTPTIKEQQTAVGATSYGTVSYPALTDYRIIESGSHEVVIGELKKNLRIEPGKYYTIAATQDGELLPFSEMLLENPAKSHVYLYNLSNVEPIQLIAPKHNMAVLEAVKINNLKSRDINALTISLEVKHADTSIQTFNDVVLKRRVGTSFLVTGNKDNLSALTVENRIAK